MDADADKIDLVPDEPAEYIWVPVGRLMAKVKERYLTDQVFHACYDVLDAGRREKPQSYGRISDMRAEGKNVLVLDHEGTIALYEGKR